MRFLIAALAICLATSACNDPTKGKPAAKVGEAKTPDKPADKTDEPSGSNPTGEPSGSNPTGDPTANPTSAATPTPTPAAGAVTYAIAPSADTSIGFIGAKVTATHEGTFTSFTGSIVVTDKAPEKSVINVEIDMKSVTGDPASLPDQLKTHLMSKDFFDVEQFPKATFVSTEIKAGGEGGATHTITGDLNFHGVKKSISFPATITMADDAITASSEFSIQRQDFGLVYPGQADNLIKDGVLLKLKIKALKK